MIVAFCYLITDFMTGADDSFVDDNATVLAALYLWATAVLTNGILRLMLRILGIAESMGHPRPTARLIAATLFAVIWFLMPVVYIVSTTLLIAEIDYVESKGAVPWPISMLMATGAQVCFKFFACYSTFEPPRTPHDDKV